MAKGGAAMVLVVLAAATTHCPRVTRSRPSLPQLEHPAKTDGSLSLLVIRDISLELRSPPIYALVRRSREEGSH